MARNDPATGAENIVQLPHVRRAAATPPRLQASPVVAFDSWAECRDRAAAALLGGTKRMLLTGSAGTGKTVLIDHVARVLRAAGRTAVIQLADADPAPPAAGVTLFVDEADRLSDAKLRVLLGAGGTVVLAGLGTLLPRRVPAGTVHLTLAPLGREAARDYIVQWLALTGRTPADLDSLAVRRLVEVSGGVPRLLSTLLTAASWLAETNGAATITAGHVQEAAELRSVLVPDPGVAPDVAPPARRGRAFWSGLLAGGVVIAAAAAVAPRFFPAETERAFGRAASLAGTAERWIREEMSGTATQRAGPPARPAPIVPPPPPIVASPEPPSPVVVSPVAVPPVVAPPVVAAPVVVPPVVVPPVVAPPVVALPVVAPPVVAPPVVAPPVVAAEPRLAPTPAAEPVHAAVVPVAPAPVVLKKALPLETINFLIRRGREMRELNDFSAARLLFHRAADDGSAEAMFDLGTTYDPANLDPVGEHAQADLPEAMRWYRRAAEAGSAEAAKHISKK